MKGIYERHKVWMPWRWLPIVVFLAIMHVAAGVFFLERKARVALAAVAGSPESCGEWGLRTMPQIPEQRPTEEVEVFPTRRTGTSAVRGKESQENSKAGARPDPAVGPPFRAHRLS